MVCLGLIGDGVVIGVRVVFIAKVYINSNIEIAIEVTMYYFQSLKWERKTNTDWISLLNTYRKEI